MRGSHVCILAALAIALPFATGQNTGSRTTRWDVRHYPNSYSDLEEEQRQCGRNQKSSICDPNGIISEQEADEIDSIIDTIRYETICACDICRAQKRGYIVRVALMPEMVPIWEDMNYNPNARLRDTQMYTYMLMRKWNHFGVCNETVMVVYSRDDNILYTMTGPTARVTLPDEYVQTIQLAVRQYFDDVGTIAEGLIELMRRYKLVFEGEAERALDPSLLTVQ